jgi:hypothetical protein
MGVSTLQRAVIVLVSAAAGSAMEGRVAAAQARTLAVAPIGSIGVESGDRRTEFGHIEGVAVDDGRGVLFLVDRLNARLSAFTRDGRFIAAAGRAGSGPGEFRSAGAVAAEGSTVYVLDLLNVRISTFVLRGNSLAWAGDTRLPFDARDLCVLDGQLFLLGYHGGLMVHRFDLRSGRVAASFGQPFEEGDAMMGALTASGYIHCDGVSRSVFVTAVSTPTVRRYSPAGQLLWETAIPRVAPSVITRTPAGVRFSPPRNRQNPDVVVSLTAVPGGRLLVQFGESWRGIGSLEDVVRVKTVLFDVRSGAVLRTLDNVPRIDFARDRYAYSHANDPFPRVVVYTWR